MKQKGFVHLSIFIVFIVILVGAGVYFYRQNRLLNTTKEGIQKSSSPASVSENKFTQQSVDLVILPNEQKEENIVTNLDLIKSSQNAVFIFNPIPMVGKSYGCDFSILSDLKGDSRVELDNNPACLSSSQVNLIFEKKSVDYKCNTNIYGNYSKVVVSGEVVVTKKKAANKDSEFEYYYDVQVDNLDESKIEGYKGC